MLKRIKLRFMIPGIIFEKLRSRKYGSILSDNHPNCQANKIMADYLIDYVLFDY